MVRKALTDEELIASEEKAKEKRRIWSLNYYHRKKEDEEFRKKGSQRACQRFKEKYANDEEFRKKHAETCKKVYQNRKERLKKLAEEKINSSEEH